MDKCVLIVDDNDFNRELVKDILEDEDITVYEAEDGSSAIELLESEQADDIDVGSFRLFCLRLRYSLVF